MNDFEELARRSVEAADDSVRRLAVPDIVARRRRRPLVLGLALGVLLLVVGVVVWQSGDGTAPTEVGPETAGEGRAVDTGDAVDEQFFRLEWPTSGGFDPPFAVDLAGDDRDFPMGTTKVYGRGTPEDPFAEADLMLVTLVEDEETAGELPDERTTVRGKTGWIDPTMLDLGFRSAIGWRETDELIVTVSSRSMTQEELTDLAESLDFEGPEVSFVSSLGLVIDIDSPPVLFAGPGTDGWLLAYSTMPDEGASVSLYGEEAGPEMLLLWRYFFAPDGVAVSVRGEKGWLSTSPGLSPLGGGVTERLVWSEGGVVLSLAIGDGPAAGGLSAVEIAGELVEVDAARWAELVAGADGFARQVGGEVEVIVQGNFIALDQSNRWRLLIDESLSLCLSVDFGDAVYTSCTGRASAGEEVTPSPGMGSVGFSVEERWFEVWGPIGDDVDRLVLELPDGSSMDLAIYSPQSIETRVFGALIPRRSADGAYELVAMATDGTELERRSFVDDAPIPLIPELPEAVLALGSADGITWVYREDQGSRCWDIGTVGVMSTSCGNDDPINYSEWTDDPRVGDRLAVWGVVAECVGSVQLVEFGPTGNIESESTYMIEGAPRIFFASVPITDRTNRPKVIYRDTDGAILIELDARDPNPSEFVC